MSRVPDTDVVTAIWHHPFCEGTATRAQFLPEEPLSRIIDSMQLGTRFAERGTAILIGPDGTEHQLDRARWHRIRLKPGQIVSLHRAPTDPGGGGNARGKSAALIGLVIAVATLATAGWALAGAGGLFTAGSFGAKALAAGISLVGALARSALSKPPAADDNSSLDNQRRGAAAVSGNVLAAGAPIPRVVGTRRIYPPLACQPLTERVGKDEFAEAVYVLSGPHKIEDIRIGDSPIADEEDIEVSIREGWLGDTDNGLVNRHAKTKAPQIELSAHMLNASSSTGNLLENTQLPQKSLPRWHSLNAKLGDELWLHFTAPEGMYDRNNADAYQVIPLRIRMRKLDTDAWINLPELHYSSNKAGEVRISVLIKRTATLEVVPATPENEGFVAAFKYMGGQSAPFSDAYSADAIFSAGAGSDGLYSRIEASSKVLRTGLYDNRAEIFLDPATFDSGEWKFEIKRGGSYQKGTVDWSSYPTSGSTDFFHFKSGNKPPRAMGAIADRLYLLRASSVTNAQPVTGTGLTVIAVRARGRQIDALSVKASGYVGDWDGTGWNNFITTSNPAPHFRDVLCGVLSADPLPLDLIDEAELLAWRNDCNTNGWTCDLVCEGAAVTEVLDRLASCGYARPRASETWGVVRDRDRSAEEPIQIFTQRNSAELSLDKAFARLPDGFRAIFREASNLDLDREIIVWREGREGTINPRLEEVRLEGLSTETAVRARARFDLRQAELRSAFWSFKAPAEAIRCTRGSLIGVNHDMLSEAHGSARISGLDIESGMIIAVITDALVPVKSAPDLHATVDIRDVLDFQSIGTLTAIEIRQSDGAISTHAVTTVSASDFGQRNRIILSTPVAVALADDGKPVIRAGNLLQIGPAGAVSRRLIVANIEFDQNLHGQITCVPEAPELWI